MPIYSHFGKKEYLDVTMPEGGWKYSYSAEKLQQELDSLLTGKKITAIFTSLIGYLEAIHNDTNVIDLTYLGGTSLILCEKTVFHLAIHVEGMIEYRHFPIWELKLRKVFDYPPDDMIRNDKYFFDVSKHDITFDYKGKMIASILVKGTDTWPFPQPGFDEGIARVAAERNDLPAEIDVRTTDCEIRFAGESLENYWIILDYPTDK